MPPYPKTQPGRMLGATLGRAPPRLDKLQHSEGLSDLVAFVLESKPADRPSMHQVLQHPYIQGSEETHPTESLAELVKTYYRWEHSGGQRQSLFMNSGAAAAEFPPTLVEEDDWNFSTTSNFEQELEGFSFDPDTLKDPATSVKPENASEASNGQAADYSFPSPIVVPAVYPLNPSKATPRDGEHWPPHGERTLLEKINTEERVKRGEKAFTGLFNEQKPPYQYKVKADFIEQKSVPTTSALSKPLSRTRSDLPLRDESVQSAVHRKEIDTDHLRSASYDKTPNIDLATVNTIKALRMNRFIENMGHDDRPEISPFYGEIDKRATKDWTFTQALYGDANGKNSDKPIAAVEPNADIAVEPNHDVPTAAIEPDHDIPSAAIEPKRATMDWGFPDMNSRPEDSQPSGEPLALRHFGPKDSHPMYGRPATKHMATAPVGGVRQSMGGMIDLDALYDSELYDSDILRTAPVSDDEPFSGLTSEDEGMSRSASNEGSNAQVVMDDVKTALPAGSISGKGIATHPNLLVAASGGLEIGNNYDPFLFDDSSSDEAKVVVNRLINRDRDGFTHVTDHARIGHEYRGYFEYPQAQKDAPAHLQKDMEQSGYGGFKSRRFATALGEYSDR